MRRLHTLPVTQAEKVREMNVVKEDARSNVYPLRIIDCTSMNRYNMYPPRIRKTAWEKMGYIHILQPTIKEENIFKDTPIQIVFKPINTLSHLTKEWGNTRNESEQSGVYKLTYHTCGMAYIGQTGRELKRYKEHCRYIKPNNPNLTRSTYLKKNKHENGPTLTLTKLIKAKKSKLFDLRKMSKYQISR